MFITLETSEVDTKPWQDHLQTFYANKITIVKKDLFTNWVGTNRCMKSNRNQSCSSKDYF